MSSKSVEEIFGIHASRAALKNPRRKVYSIVCTQDFYDNYSYDLRKKNIDRNVLQINLFRFYFSNRFEIFY